MKWRRIAEMLHLRNALRLQDERSRKGTLLNGLEREAEAVEAHVDAISETVRQRSSVLDEFKQANGFLHRGRP